MSEGSRKEVKILGWLIGLFAVLYYLPVEAARFQGALVESFKLVKWYAREHVLLCLVPAFFIAGAIGVFVSQNAVMKYFGPKANKLLSYGVASVSGTILAVCFCPDLQVFRFNCYDIWEQHEIWWKCWWTANKPNISAAPNRLQ